METKLWLADGNLITKAQIHKAIAEKRAVIRWRHGVRHNVGSLLILDTLEDADLEAERDTVGDCHLMSNEIWSERPKSYMQALRAAARVLRQS